MHDIFIRFASKISGISKNNNTASERFSHKKSVRLVSFDYLLYGSLRRSLASFMSRSVGALCSNLIVLERKSAERVSVDAKNTKSKEESLLFAFETFSSTAIDAPAYRLLIDDSVAHTALGAND
jgi:hypothetical protein